MGARTKTAPDAAPPRLRRVVGVGEALQRTLDPAFRKRGFGSRDLIVHWAAIVPQPFGEVAAPDRLTWPRGERSAEGATLYLRCRPGHALMLQHEAPLIARAINRYFGYFLISSIRISLEPLEIKKEEPPSHPAEPPPKDPELDALVAGIDDDVLRAALHRLGRGIKGKMRT